MISFFYEKKNILYCIVYMFIIVSCASTVNNEHELNLNQVLKKSEKEYSSSNWQTRLDAIKKITAQLYVIKLQHDPRLVIRPKNYHRVIRLLLSATKDSHSIVQVNAIRGIAAIIPVECKDRLVLLSQHKNNNVRWYAIQTLAYYNDENLLPVFARGLSSDDWLIREASIKGLLKYNPDILKQQNIISYILRSIHDRNQSVVLATLSNLHIKDQRIYIKLKAMLDQTPDHHTGLLKALLSAMHGYRLDEKSRKRIIDLLLHRNTEIRLLALRVLKEEQLLFKQE